MRTVIQPRFDGIRSSAALKDFAIGLGCGFMKPKERAKKLKKGTPQRALLL
jgi:hypothetical protein